MGYQNQKVPNQISKGEENLGRKKCLLTVTAFQSNVLTANLVVILANQK